MWVQASHVVRLLCERDLNLCMGRLRHDVSSSPAVWCLMKALSLCKSPHRHLLVLLLNDHLAAVVAVLTCLLFLIDTPSPTHTHTPVNTPPQWCTTTRSP
jgi:hypothetical protein